MFQLQGAHFASVQIHSSVVEICNFKPVYLNQVLPIIYMDYFPAPIFQILTLLSKWSTIFRLLGMLSNIFVSNSSF